MRSERHGADEWPRAPLGDVVTIHHGFAFRGEYFRDQGSADILLTPGNFALGGGFTWHKTKYYEGPVDDRYVLTPGDLIITMTDLSKGADTLGSPALVPSPPDGVRLLHNQRLGLVEITAPDRVDRNFLYSVLRSNTYRRHIVATATGTTVKHTSPTRLEQALIPLPPLSDQRRIARVLDALDDKIECNRRLAALAEESAATLFRARFVDFIGAEDLDDSEIGPIPRGWRVGALSDLARFVNGKAFTKHANSSGRPIIRIRELNDGVDQGTPHSDVEAEDDFIARFDDILFAWSGSLGAYRWPGEESLINQHIFKVIPNGWPAWFVFAWIEEHMETFRAIARDKATTMGHIQRRHLAEATLALPTGGGVTGADAVVGPLDLQRAALVSESRTLTVVRDALLPKLISGQIRVSATNDPAKVIEPAAEALRAAAQ